MALDNAQFIAELQIDDPPGTDNLDEGDDHIRTVKRATQQSFPNVDAAVPQTAAQMAQMAIKNEVNLFTQNNTFQAAATFSAATAAVIIDAGPSSNLNIAFDLDTVRQWLLRSNAAASVFSLRRFVGGVFIDSPIEVSNVNGESTFAQSMIIDTPGTSGRALSWATNGVVDWAWNMDSGNPQYRLRRFTGGVFQDNPIAVDSATGVVKFPNQTTFGNGSNSAPSIAFTNSTNLGMFRIGTDSMGFAAGAGTRLTVEGTAVTAQPTFIAQSTCQVEGQLVVNAASDAVNDLRFQRSLVNRWTVRMGNDGNNNDFQIRRFNDVGTLQDTPFQIQRSDGLMIMNQLPTTDPGVSGALWRDPVSPGFVAIV